MTISSSSKAAGNQSGATKVKHVLVVDDDPEIADSIRNALANAGFEASVALDGNTCIAMAETKNPDLIILDLMMPKRSGLLVLETLRLKKESLVPVIVITGNTGQRHRSYAELFGIQDYVQKPFTMSRLVDSVCNLLSA